MGHQLGVSVHCLQFAICFIRQLSHTTLPMAPSFNFIFIVGVVPWMLTASSLSSTTVSPNKTSMFTTTSLVQTPPSGNTTLGTVSWSSTADPNCSDNDLHIFDMYVRQSQLIELYSDRCGYLFVEIAKQKYASEMLVVGSIFDEDENSTTVTVKLFNQLPFPTRGFMYYRVVVRFSTGYPNRTTVLITVGGRVFPLELLPKQQLLEYMLPDLMYNTSTSLPTITVPSEQLTYVLSSYAMVCLNFQYPNVLCRFVVHGTRVQCYCPLDESGHVLVGIELAVLWVLVVAYLAYFYMWQQGPHEPEMQLNMVLCLPGQSSHEYLCVFRVGLATDGFSYKHNHVDLQLLTGDMEAIGQTIRFSCRNLPNQMCAEMHMYVGRISPMPPITGIRASHNDAHNLLHFQDFAVINLRGVYTLVQEETIDQFITSEPSIFRPIPKEPAGKEKPKNRSLEKRKSSDSQVLASSKRSWLPLISTGRVHVPEKTAIFVLVLGFVGFLAMLARIRLHAFEYWKDMSNFVVHFIACLFAISGLSCVLICLLELLYTFCIGRHYLVEAYQRATVGTALNQGPSYFRVIRMLYLVLCHLLGLILAGLTFELCRLHKLDYISACFWSGVLFCSVILTVGIWFVLEEWIILSLKAVRSQKDYLQMLTTDKLSPSLAKGVNSNQSSLFKYHLSSSTVEKGPLSSRSSNFGPRLINPNFPSTISSQELKDKATSRNSCTINSSLKKKGNRNEGTGKLVSLAGNGRKSIVHTSSVSVSKNLSKMTSASKVPSKWKSGKVRFANMEANRSSFQANKG